MKTACRFMACTFFFLFLLSRSPAFAASTAEAAFSEPESHLRQTMMIGLCYANERVPEAQFRNKNGGSFYIGYYDEDRKFQTQLQLNPDSIRVRPAKDQASLEIYDGDGKNLLYAASECLELSLLPTEGSEQGRTEFMEEHYRGGFTCRLEDGLLTVINYVALEDYVKGVLPYEMGSSWHYEALKAQAVCARNYAVYPRDDFKAYGFDLSDDVYAQVYRGLLWSDAITDQAVEDTSGQLLRYEGRICEVYYYSSNGGATENGGLLFDSEEPYLKGKLDPYEGAIDYPLKDWTIVYKEKELLKVLQARGCEIQSLALLEPRYSSRGNVVSVSLTDKDGNRFRLDGREAYTTLGLNSCRYTLSVEEGKYVFSGSGWGHSCGMSQWGAQAMASVYDYTYEEILGFYFTGAYVA